MRTLDPRDPAMIATFRDTEPQAHPADLEQLRADLTALRRELQAVRVARSSDTTAGLRDLRTKLAQLQQQLDSSATREPASAASQGEAALESPEEREREHTSQLVAFLDGQFQSEAVDTQWGSQAEAQITDAFSLEALQASRLRGVRCQATMCRVEVDYIDTDAERAFMTHLGKLEAFVNAEAFYERTDHDDGSVATLIYVARSGHRLPEPPEPL